MVLVIIVITRSTCPTTAEPAQKTCSAFILTRFNSTYNLRECKNTASELLLLGRLCWGKGADYRRLSSAANPCPGSSKASTFLQTVDGQAGSRPTVALAGAEDEALAAFYGAIERAEAPAIGKRRS